MTDNKIIMAAEGCVSYAPDCDVCPYTHRGDKAPECMGSLMEDLLSLINRQKAEIERRTINMNAYALGMKAESERADNTKADAIKEFAERLKEKGTPVTGGKGFEGVYVMCSNIAIDNLVKEMAGDVE